MKVSGAARNKRSKYLGKKSRSTDPVSGGGRAIKKKIHHKRNKLTKSLHYVYQNPALSRHTRKRRKERVLGNSSHAKSAKEWSFVRNSWTKSDRSEKKKDFQYYDDRGSSVSPQPGPSGLNRIHDVARHSRTKSASKREKRLGVHQQNDDDDDDDVSKSSTESESGQSDLDIALQHRKLSERLPKGVRGKYAADLDLDSELSDDSQDSFPKPAASQVLCSPESSLEDTFLRDCILSDPAPTDDDDGGSSEEAVFSCRTQLTKEVRPMVSRTTPRTGTSVASAGSGIPRIFSCAKTGVIILMMNHPMSVTLHGKAAVRVVSGTVSILGYSLSSEATKFVPVYSSRKLCSLQIVTTVSQVKNPAHLREMGSVLGQFAKPNVVSDVTNKCSHSSVILMLKMIECCPTVDFACFYIPSALTLDKSEDSDEVMSNKGFTLTNGGDGAVQLPVGYESIADSVNSVVRHYDLNDGRAACIMVYGKRGLGKSTLLRYLVNGMLQSYSKVCYLDCDPGQSEFTPPGCLSLSVVTDPILGPPFTHSRSPAKMFFFGTKSIECPDRYVQCIRELASTYMEQFSDVPLFINTFGWIQGVGKECLDQIRIVFSPSMEIQLVARSDSSADAVNSIPDVTSNEEVLKITVPSIRPEESPQLSALVRRNLSVLSYFGHCQPYYESVKPLNHVKPYCMRAEDIVLHVATHTIFPTGLLRAVNASIVALCVVDESQILICVDGSLPRRLIPNANFGTCVGFGFVRAIDPEQGLLYVITPEPIDVLMNVNALIKGNIDVPEELFMKQEIDDVPLPYLRQIIAKRCPSGRKMKRQ